MDDLNAVTLELLRMFSGRAFYNSGPDFANALSSTLYLLGHSMALIVASDLHVDSDKHRTPMLKHRITNSVDQSSTLWVQKSCLPSNAIVCLCQ